MANVVYFNEGIKIPCCPTLLESIYLASSGSCCTDSNTPYTGFVAGNLTYNIIYTLPTTSGTTGQVLTTDGNNNLSWTTVSGGGGSGTPSGTDGLIQYNNGGAFGGATTLYWNDLNSRLGINTSNPNQTLEVAGTMRLTGSTGTPVSIMGRNSSGDIGDIVLDSNFILSGGTLSLSGVTVSGYVPYTGATQNVNLGSYSVTSSGVTTPYLQISATGSPTPLQVGMIRYNDTDKTLEFLMGGGNVTQQIGQELPIPVKNADNAGLINGKVVYFVNSNGTNKLVRYPIASGQTGSAQVIGLMTESASGGDKALCTTFGLVRDINTSTLQEGKIVWLSATELGGMTTTRPLAPNHGVQIGFCIRQHATKGSIFVSVQNGYEIDELHNVLISSGITNNDLLLYNSALQVWENKQASSANLITGTGTATQIAFWDGATGTTSSALTSSSNLYWDNEDKTVKILGVNNLVGSSSLMVNNSDNINILNVRNNGVLGVYSGSDSTGIRINNTAGLNTLGLSLTSGRIFFNQVGTILFSQSSTVTNNGSIRIQNNQAAYNPTTVQTATELGIGSNFAPTSGVSNYRTLLLNPTLNQTGGASGTTIGIHIDPTITAAFNWRSIEWTNNTGYGLYGSGTAPNYLAGNTSIGTITPSARLHVVSSSNTNSTWTAQFHNSSGTNNALMIRDDGNVGIGTSGTTARLVVRGSGSTIATAALLVQNSGGTDLFVVEDDGTVGVGTNAPNTSALLDISSTTRGFLSPRMSTTQRDAIVSPAQGLEIFNTTITSKQVYNGTEWEILNGARQIVVASSITTPVVFRNGNVVDLVLQSSTTLTLSNAAVGNYIIKITQSGSGSNTVSWPVNVLWSGGFTPTLTPTVGKQDVITLLYDGTNYYGTYALNF
jgi:hypothetical protein